MIFVGIDPGVKTGFAVAQNRDLKRVDTAKACEAEAEVLRLSQENNGRIVVHVEDARLRQWFGSKGREVLQGAGSVKRDCSRWQEFLVHYQIPHVLVSPRSNKTKLTADQFKQLTGWRERTSEHGRDAAMLVWGRG